jgi:hypothetical protein
MSPRPNADSTPTGTGARECSARPHVSTPDSSIATPGSSMASPDMLFPLNIISAQKVQASSSGSGLSSPPAEPPVRHGTLLQHGISKPKVYMDGKVRYSLFSTTGEP